jgi:hypothetical protein
MTSYRSEVYIVCSWETMSSKNPISYVAPNSSLDRFLLGQDSVTWILDWLAPAQTSGVLSHCLESLTTITHHPVDLFGATEQYPRQPHLPPSFVHLLAWNHA